MTLTTTNDAHRRRRTRRLHVAAMIVGFVFGMGLTHLLYQSFLMSTEALTGEEP